MRTLHRTIPVFIPELACPHRCIYCNQFRISGQSQLPSSDEIAQNISARLSTFPPQTHVEIGFFGGTFTGLPLALQQEYLEMVEPYLASGAVDSIRLSTRPDRIDKENVRLLKSMGVSTIELGVQSLDPEVLRQSGRGYRADDVVRAAEIIQEQGLEVGMQMMIGLPGDTREKAIATARKIVSLGATNTRIYPTLVVRDTVLESLYKKGLYIPLTIDQAVGWTKDLLQIYYEAHVVVLRVGLHPTQGLISGEDYLAGPFHVSFKELVQTALWRDVFEKALQSEDVQWTVFLPPLQVNAGAGYQGTNRDWLLTRLRKVSFRPDPTLHDFECRIERLGSDGTLSSLIIS